MLAVLLLLAIQGLEPAPPTSYDKVIALEVHADGSVLAGHGPSKRIEYEAQFSGTLHVWTNAARDVDLFLRLDDEDGKLVAEDDNSGGGNTPYVTLDVEPGRKLTIHAALAKGVGSGAFELHAVAAPETQTTREAALAADRALAQITALREKNELVAARELAEQALDELLDVAGANSSEAVMRSAWSFGWETSALSILVSTSRAWGFAWAHRARTLPEDHPALQDARGNLANTIRRFGDLARVRALEEQVLEVRTRTLPEDHPALQIARENLAGTLGALGDLARARALQERVLEVRARTLPEDHPDLQRARQNLAGMIAALGDLHLAREMQEHVLESRARTLPDDHRDLQSARQNLADTIRALGDLTGARALEEQVLEVRSRMLPDDHPDLQAARLNLAWTIRLLGDLTGARALEEKALEVRSRTLPDDHSDLQVARRSLAETIRELGDLAGARALQEKVLEVRTRTLPDDHPSVLAARASLSSTLHELGDLTGARVLQEQVLEVYSRTLNDDHPDLQAARSNLAITIKDLGDLAGARALQEQALESYSRTLPHDHTNLNAARGNLAITLKSFGDLARARALEETVLDVCSRTLPDDHPALQAARLNLASTIAALGDLAGARALQEKVLEVRSRTLPDDHPALQLARGNLAATMHKLGDFTGARPLQEQVLETCSRTLPDDHPHLQRARLNLATTISALGDLAGARVLQAKVLEVNSRTLPDDHPDLQWARGILAITTRLLGDLAGARALDEQVLEVRSRTLPEDYPDLQVARIRLAVSIAWECARAEPTETSEGEDQGKIASERKRCADLLGAVCRAQVRAARAAILGSSCREAEESCSSLARQLDISLSFARGYGVFQPLRTLESESFDLSETTRGAAIVSAELTRKAAGSPKYGELRVALRRASAALAELAQKGATSTELDRARSQRESVERELVALAGELSGGGENTVEVEVESVAERLAERDAAVCFRRVTTWRVDVVDEPDVFGQPGLRETSVDSLFAFVVRSSKVGARHDASSALTLVDLGPIEPIETAVERWRDALGVGRERGIAAAHDDARELVERGDDLRALVLDPLAVALQGVERMVVALDDVLHAVPLDALPAGRTWHGAATAADERDASPEGVLFGDVRRVELRHSLFELVSVPKNVSGEASLLALGHPAFDRDPVELASESQEAQPPTIAEPTTANESGRLRPSLWERGFTTLPETRAEVRAIANYFEEEFGETSAKHLLERAQASRENLFALAPKARFLHLATHGWFAPESVRSSHDPEPLDALSGLGFRTSGEERVRGMSPMLLCGLALAGANLPAGPTGRIPGLVTAEELSTLDLSHCELAVLSACDTNVGVRRAGQGVASLQRALHMAGARSVITSLWKVPDEATKELMVDFYRRLWVEKKPKSQALWEAKSKLRNARDERGSPLYTTRDWAAWVLTGGTD